MKRADDMQTNTQHERKEKAVNEFDPEAARQKKIALGFRATTVDVLCLSAHTALAENIAACETGDDIVDVRLGTEGVILVFAPGASLSIAIRHLEICGFPIEKVRSLNALFMPWSPAQPQTGAPQIASWGGTEQTDLAQGNDLGMLWLSRSAARNRSRNGVPTAT